MSATRRRPAGSNARTIALPLLVLAVLAALVQLAGPARAADPRAAGQTRALPYTGWYGDVDTVEQSGDTDPASSVSVVRDGATVDDQGTVQPARLDLASDGAGSTQTYDFLTSPQHSGSIDVGYDLHGTVSDPYAQVRLYAVTGTSRLDGLLLAEQTATPGGGGDFEAVGTAHFSGVQAQPPRPVASPPTADAPYAYGFLVEIEGSGQPLTASATLDVSHPTTTDDISALDETDWIGLPGDGTSHDPQADAAVLGGSHDAGGGYSVPRLEADPRQSVSSETFSFLTTADRTGTLAVPWSLQTQDPGVYDSLGLVATPHVDPGADQGECGCAYTDVGPDQVLLDPQDLRTAGTGTVVLQVTAGVEYGFQVTIDPGGESGEEIAPAELDLGVPMLQSSPYQDPGQVEANTSWPNATTIGSGSPVTGVLDAPGQSRWFKVPIVPDSTVTAQLTKLTQNYDLTVYKDIGQAFTSLTSTQDLTHLTAEYAGDVFSPSVYSPSVYSPSVYSPSVYSPSVYSPSVYSPSVYSPSVYSPSVYSPSVYSPSVYSPSAAFLQAFSGAQTRSLIGVSAQDGTAPESVTAASWDNTGYDYIRVAGRNGADDPDHPFTLGVTSAGGPCQGVALDTYGDRQTLTGTAGSAASVIVTDTSRMRLSGGDLATYRDQLGQLATATDGVVVDVAGSQRIRALNEQADAHPGCPYAKNLVAQAIRDVVGSYRDSAGTVKDVVLAGGDAVVPFFRYPDAAGIGPESGYVPPVLDASASQASLRTSDVLGQDAYGSLLDLSVKGSVLPVPDLPVGRLVETPAEIEGSIAAYLALDGGTLPTSSSLVTGYDFLTRAADSVEGDLAAGMAAGDRHDTLITDQGVPATTTTGPSGPSRSTSWTADDLRTALFSQRHDVVFLAGHFSANSALAADYSTSLLTDQVAANPDLLRDSLVFSAGCHSGYNIVDGDAVPDLTDTLDWPQLMAQQHATLVAGTGYQYADTDFLAYSAKLYALMAHHLRDGAAGTTEGVGSALVAAKQQYLSEATDLSGIDEKTLIEATVYGIPSIGVDLPNRNPAPVAAAPVATTASADGTPGATLGLRASDLSVDTPTTPNSRAAVDTSGAPTGTSYRWLSGSAGVSTQPALPALPLQQVPATADDGSVLRGVGFRSGTYDDTTGVTPLTGAPATETDGVHTSFDSPAFFPQQLARPNYTGALTGTGATVLNLTPAQYRSDGDGTDTERAYRGLGLRLFYSANTGTYGQNTPALAAPPSISGVTGATAGSAVEVAAHVTGDPSAGIQGAWVTYTAESGPLHGRWQSVDLAQDDSDSTLWTGSVPLPSGQDPSQVRFLLQAVNGVGLVGLDDDLGDGYTPDVSVGTIPVGAAATQLTLDPAPGSVPVGGTVTLSATLTGAPAGAPLTFDIGAGTQAAATDGGGHAVVHIPVRSAPGRLPVSVGYAGDATHQPAVDTGGPLTVMPAPTSLQISGADGGLASGVASGVTAQLTDARGLPVSQRAVQWTVRSGSTVVASVSSITDGSGTARLGTLTLPAGDDTVSAAFGSVGSGQAPDPVYAAATDSAALSVSVPFAVRAPAQVVAAATSAAGAVVSYAVTTTTDALATCAPASGSTFAIGTTQVSCTAQDGEGQTASDRFEVTVTDAAMQLVGLAAKAEDTPVAGSAARAHLDPAAQALQAAAASLAVDGTLASRADADTFFAQLQAAQQDLSGISPKMGSRPLLVSLRKGLSSVAVLEASLRIARAQADGASPTALRRATTAMWTARPAAGKGDAVRALRYAQQSWDEADAAH